MHHNTNDCPVCAGIGHMTDWVDGKKVRKQCEDCLPAISLREKESEEDENEQIKI